MYLTTENISLINAVKAKAKKSGLVFARTNSRFNGHYMVRIYRCPEDKGHPCLAVIALHTPAEFREYLA